MIETLCGTSPEKRTTHLGIVRAYGGQVRMRRATAGFTLIEALVAAAVMAIAISGIIRLQGEVFQSSKNSGELSVATRILEHRLEELGSIPTAALAGLNCTAAPGCRDASGNAAATPNGCTQVIDGPLGITQTPAVAGRFRVDTGMEAHPDARHPNALLATVSVCWLQNGQLKMVWAQRALSDR